MFGQTFILIMMNDKVYVDYVEDDIIDFFLERLEYYKSDKKFEQRVPTMEGNYFSTGNLLQFADAQLIPYLQRIKKQVEQDINQSLTYRYLHMLDYSYTKGPFGFLRRGGSLLRHNHRHAEDYTSLLYLNDCKDGATFFFLNDKREEIQPEKSKLVMYPSIIDHGSNYSTSKKILVSGYNYG